MVLPRPKHFFCVCVSTPLLLCLFFHENSFWKKWMGFHSKILGILFPGGDAFDSAFGILTVIISDMLNLKNSPKP